MYPGNKLSLALPNNPLDDCILAQLISLATNAPSLLRGLDLCCAEAPTGPALSARKLSELFVALSGCSGLQWLAIDRLINPSNMGCIGALGDLLIRVPLRVEPRLKQLLCKIDGVLQSLQASYTVYSDEILGVGLSGSRAVRKLGLLGARWIQRSAANLSGWLQSSSCRLECLKLPLPEGRNSITELFQGLRQCSTLLELELVGKLTPFTTTLLSGWLSNARLRLRVLRLYSSELPPSQLQQLFQALQKCTLHELALIDPAGASWCADETLAVVALMQSACRLSSLTLRTDLTPADAVSILASMRVSRQLVHVDLCSNGLGDWLDANVLAELCCTLQQVSDFAKVQHKHIEVDLRNNRWRKEAKRQLDRATTGPSWLQLRL